MSTLGRKVMDKVARKVVGRVLGLAVAGLLCAAGLLPRNPRPSRRATRSPRTIRPAPGRDDTFYACTPCHGFKVVAQQGQTRRQWDDTLDWMTERHAMPRPRDADRKIMLDYLEAAFPPRTSQRGWQNPFQKR